MEGKGAWKPLEYCKVRPQNTPKLTLKFVSQLCHTLWKKNPKLYIDLQSWRRQVIDPNAVRPPRFRVSSCPSQSLTSSLINIWRRQLGFWRRHPLNSSRPSAPITLDGLPHLLLTPLGVTSSKLCWDDVCNLLAFVLVFKSDGVSLSLWRRQVIKSDSFQVFAKFFISKLEIVQNAPFSRILVPST